MKAQSIKPKKLLTCNYFTFTCKHESSFKCHSITTFSVIYQFFIRK